MSAPAPNEQTALDLCQAGRPEEAEALYRILRKAPAQSVTALMTLAETARILGHAEDAVAWLEGAVHASPAMAEAWSALGLALITLNRIEEGEEACREALRRSPGTASAHRALAIAHLRRNRLAQAAEECGHALRATPGAPASYPEGLATLALVRMLEGRLDEADGLFRDALAAKPAMPEALGNHAALLARLGHDTEALERAEQTVAQRPRMVNALHLIGTLHHRAGQVEAAIAAFRRVLDVDPHHLNARQNLADTLRLAGRNDEAAAVCREGLAGNPDHPGLLTNLGAALQAKGDARAALDVYRQALRVAPDLPEVHNNLAHLLREAGDTDAALAQLRQAVAARPGSTELRLNLLRLLLDAERLAEAEAAGLETARTAPADAELAFQIGLLFARGGWRDRAIPYFRQAIRLSPGTAQYWPAFSHAVRDLRFTGSDEGLRADLLAAIGRPDVEVADLARPIASVLIQSPLIARLAALAEAGGDAEALALLRDGSLAALAEDRLLLGLLETTMVCDAALERALTLVRRTLLMATAGVGLADRPAWRLLSSALAQQGFANEYAFAETDGEVKVVAALAAMAAGMLDRKEQPPAILIALIGAYRPLHRWERAAELLALPWPPETARLLDRQIAEPAAEARIEAELPALTPIHNAVSRDVRAQYEENPYPRWLNTGQPALPLALPRLVRSLFPHVGLPASPSWDAPEVLIAGCGTGREAVWSASTIKGARVLAVDLSRRSLAYAKRQSQRLGLAIDFAQADLLELDALGRRFDVIHSVGVLHHLEDPMAGLRGLRGLLRPHGVMEIGFYSAAARRPILAARQLIAERGYPSTPAGIRRLRQDILALPADHPARSVVHSPDFYGTSACRDLLLHVREVHITLSWLTDALTQLDLEFLGFQIPDPAVSALYRRRFPDDPTMTSLARWNRLEAEHPTIFGGLYQAWVRPRG